MGTFFVDPYTYAINLLSAYVEINTGVGVATRGVGTGQSRKITKNHFSSL